MLSEIPVEQYAECLDAVAGEVLEEARVSSPPVDMLEVASRLGITLAWDDRQTVRGRYVRLQLGVRTAKPTILLRPEPRPERTQWTIAHEIGEHVAYRVFDVLGVDPRETGPAGREDVSNLLAGRLLLPTVWFRADGYELGWDLLRLKERYATASHELIARRMLEQPPPVIVTIFDLGRMTFRRSNATGRVPPLSGVEAQCRRVAHGLSRTEHARDAGLSATGWPVHEAGWKREIVRAEVEIDPFA